MRRRRTLLRELTALAGILVVAAIFRYWQIDTYPQALHYDEVINGLVTQDLLRGIFPQLLTYDLAREPMIFYVMAAPVWLFGPTPGALRAATATVSLATTIGVFLLTREFFGRRVGLLAALIYAATVWPIYHGRLATRSILVPLMLTGSLYLGVRAWRSSQWRYWLSASVMFGGVFYTYASNLFVVPALLLSVVALSIYDLRAARERARYLWVAASIITLIALPISIFRFTHAATGPGRPIILLVFYPGQSAGDFIATALTQAALIGRMFFLKGDMNIRHNIPGRPVFDALMTAPFILGLVVAAAQRRYRTMAGFAALWLGVWLMPSYAAKDAPHFLRSSGALATLFIWPALGAAWLADQIRRRAGRLAACLVLGAIVGGSFLITAHDYILSNFLSSQEVFEAFNGPETAPVLELNQRLNTGWVGNNLFALPPPLGPPTAEHQQAAQSLPQPYAQFLAPWLYDPKSLRQY